MLAYGLMAGLEELADQLEDRAVGNMTIELQVPASEFRHDPQVEQHLYRIVQQACENALRHAQARTLRICGQIEAGRIVLEVEDDGVGFRAGEGPEFTRLLATRKYGLVGMYERAGFIGARIHIHSAPGAGTQVEVSWPGSQPSFGTGDMAIF